MGGAKANLGVVVSRRGLSVLETIISFFIILFALLLMVQLFHSSMHHGLRTEQRTAGALLAQEKLEEIRAWAATPDNFEGSWSVYEDRVFHYPNYPGFEVKTSLSEHPLASPSTLLEANFPEPQRRVLTRSSRGVTVECSWGSAASQRIRLSTVVGAPPRAFRATQPLVITGDAATPMAFKEERTFTVKAYDDAGNELPDCSFSWYVLAKSGNAVVKEQRRQGKTGTLGNWTLDIDGIALLHSPGKCLFVAKARYAGRTETASVEVVLE